MKIIKLLPGIVLPIIVALLACWLESLLPIHLIGSAVIAMFIGMFLNQFVRKTDVFATGLKFTSKKILKFAIILLGLSLNITAILHVGQMSLTVMVFNLADLLWRRLLHQQGAGTELEAVQFDFRWYRHLRWLCHCRYRPHHRRGRQRRCLRHVRHLPI